MVYYGLLVSHELAQEKTAADQLKARTKGATFVELPPGGFEPA